MKDALLVLAGGATQVPFVHAWRELGLDLIVVDRDPEAPCRHLCSLFICASAHDADAILAELDSGGVRTRIRVVLTQSSGPATVAQACISRALGLPGFAPVLAEAAIDKAASIELLREQGLSVLERLEPDAPASEPRFPLVVRPAQARIGKDAIARVDDPSMLDVAIANARRASSSGEAVITRFIEGEDLIYVGARLGAKTQHVAMVREHNHFGDGWIVNLGMELARDISDAALDRMDAEIDRLMSRMGGGNGVLLASFRVRDALPFWTELHLDFGGDWIWEHLLRRGLAEDVITGVSRNVIAGEVCWIPPPARPALLYTLLELDRWALPKIEAFARVAGLEVVRDPERSGRSAHHRIGAVIVAEADQRIYLQQVVSLDAILDRGSGLLPRLSDRLTAIGVTAGRGAV